MFDIFVKHFVLGTQVQKNVSMGFINDVFCRWEEGDELEIDGVTIPNQFIESVYIRKGSAI